MSTPHRSTPLPLVLLAAAALVALLSVVGVLYLRYVSRQHKPTSPEVRANLRALFTGAKAYTSRRRTSTRTT